MRGMATFLLSYPKTQTPLEKVPISCALSQQYSLWLQQSICSFCDSFLLSNKIVKHLGRTVGSEPKLTSRWTSLSNAIPHMQYNIYLFCSFDMNRYFVTNLYKVCCNTYCVSLIPIRDFSLFRAMFTRQ